MKPFFAKEDIELTKKKVAHSPGCAACGLHETCLSPKMPWTGDGGEGVLIVAEAPGRYEDEENTQLVGKAGKKVRETLAMFDWDLDRDCWKTNAIRCRPPMNRKPTVKEIDYCRPALLQTIKELKPKMIWPMGGVAIHSLLGHRLKKKMDKVQLWRGFLIPDQELGCWVAPMMHPSFVMRGSSGEVADVIFQDDMQHAIDMSHVGFRKFRPFDMELPIETVEIMHALRQIHRNCPPWIAFDYETTGIKPHRKGQKILTCAIADSANHVVAFPVHNERVRKALKSLLRNRRIRKIAHNMKFEEHWTREALGYRVRPWGLDTMLTTHTLDNRRGICGLKFQAYTCFGILGYDDEVDPFKKARKGEDRKSGNAFNRMETANLKSVLKYNAWDSILEFRLGMLHLRRLKRCK